MSSGLLDRIMAGVIAAGLLGLLCAAAWLTPSPSGHGTHQQFQFRSGIGLQPCTWAGLTGRPCPSCGMTTAFAHAADGELVAAFKAQPMGAVLALAASAGFWIALHVALTGSNAGALLGRMMGRRLLWCMLVLLVGAWIYKIAVWPGI